jgi:PEP-CTERM motif-containing protein
MRAVSLAKCTLGALALAFTLGLPLSASATSCSGFNLSDNNLGLSGSVGCVTVSNSGPNQVTVTISMNTGFSIKLNGGDIAFNGPSGLTLSDAGTISIESGLFKGAFTKLRQNQNIDGFGEFAFDYANIKGQPGSIVSADMISFTLTASGLTASQFTSFAIHFCTASGTNCGPTTGFAQGSGPAPVPEPGAMALLGTGFLGLASWRRTSGIIKRVWRDGGPKLLLASSQCNTKN